MALPHPSSVWLNGQSYALPVAARGRWCRISVASASRTELRPPFFAFEDEAGRLAGSHHFMVERGGAWRTVLYVPARAVAYRIDAAPHLGFQPISRAAATALIVAARRRAMPSLLRSAFSGRFREHFALLAWSMHRPEGYALWIRHFDTWTARPPDAVGSCVRIGALVFQRGSEAAALAATLASLAGQGVSMPRAVLAGAESASWREAVLALAAEYVALLQAGEVLPAHAAWLAGAELQRLGLPDVALADEDRLGPDGRRADPLFRPQPNRALMLSGTQSRGVWFIRRDALLAHSGTGDPGWAECLRLAVWLRRHEAGEAGGQRIPFILTHRREDAERAPEEAIAAVVNDHLVRSSAPMLADASFPLALRARGVPAERVAIIIPSALRSPVARTCILSVLGETAHRAFELVVGVTQAAPLDPVQRDNADAIEADPRARVVHLAFPSFNFSQVCNALTAITTADFVLLLNDDVSVLSPGWLQEMLAHLADPGVAVVGAKLLYPNGTVQHAGVIMGSGGLCNHANRNLARDAPGYAWRAVLAQEFSAVTGACLLVRRAVFDAVGGLDEGYPSAFNDVDLCLRVRELGHRVVLAATAVLVHHESHTYGVHYAGERAAFEDAEVARMRSRWRRVIADDPYYNPNLDLDPEREWQLAFPPRHLALSRNS